MWKPVSGIHRKLDAILNATEKIMVDLTALQSAVTLEAQEVAAIVAEVKTQEDLIKQLQTASAAGDQAGVDSAAASIQSSITAMKQSLATAQEAPAGTSNNPAPVEDTPAAAQPAPATPEDQDTPSSDSPDSLSGADGSDSISGS